MFSKQTYKELAEHMYKVFKDYNIDMRQITNIVTDGGSNFAKMFRIYGQSRDTETTSIETENITYQETDDVENDREPVQLW